MVMEDLEEAMVVAKGDLEETKEVTKEDFQVAMEEDREDLEEAREAFREELVEEIREVDTTTDSAVDRPVVDRVEMVRVVLGLQGMGGNSA